MNSPRRGRPRKNQRMVPIMVMVPPDLKQIYEKSAQENNWSLSLLVRLVLDGKVEPPVPM